MKARIKNLFIVPALIAGLDLIPAGRVTAQTFTTLHSFTATHAPASTNSDGANPYAVLFLSGNALYGTAFNGGISGCSTMFKVNTDGTGFTTLHSFTASSNSPAYGNRDGAFPVAGLILSGNTLYGTAQKGGRLANGTVFAVNTDGTRFTNLHSFNGSDGAGPRAGLISSGNTLYGTTYRGGSSGHGTVFKVNTDGTGFTNLHGFTFTDGAYPSAGLILSGNTLYGTAPGGGSAYAGTVFALNTNGTGFTILHNFTGGGDGGLPSSGLILSGDILYGTAENGGSAHAGTVFALNTNGTGFTTLHSFVGSSAGGEGARPQAGLILSGDTLYGTANIGGSSGAGTVFAVNTDGTGFTTLYSFTARRINSSGVYTNNDGANPVAGLILSGKTLYGTALNGGSSGNGTVFSLSLGSISAPQLTTVRSEANIVLTWPANAAGFTLQSTTNLVSPTVWTTVFPAPVIVNGHNAVTNPISGTKQFYRLTQ